MREITYQVNNWKPSVFVATKGQSDLEVLRILQAKYRSATIRLLSPMPVRKPTLPEPFAFLSL